jgi:hypothetical protein
MILRGAFAPSPTPPDRLDRGYANFVELRNGEVRHTPGPGNLDHLHGQKESRAALLGGGRSRGRPARQSDLSTATEQIIYARWPLLETNFAEFSF